MCCSLYIHAYTQMNLHTFAHAHGGRGFVVFDSHARFPGPAPPDSRDGPPPLPPLFLSLANVSGDHGKIGTGVCLSLCVCVCL